MKLPTALLSTSLALAASSSSPPTHLLTNPPPSSPDTAHTHRIPTSRESAILGRRVLALTPLATLSTVFPTTTDNENILERRPPGLGGVPIGLMDYIADCDPDPQLRGNPTILAIGIATSFKNVAAGSNMSISVNWAPPYPPKKRIESASSGGMYDRLRDWWHGADAQKKHKHKHNPDPVPYSAANLPRFSLLGYLEPIPPPDSSDSEETLDALQTCFLSAHPDARYWLPGNRIHASEWVRLVVTQVYWIGGFGDRAYIGWIPVEEWANVTRDEWEAVRLPGEKPGWEEWSLPAGEEVEL